MIIKKLASLFLITIFSFAFFLLTFQNTNAATCDMATVMASQAACNAGCKITCVSAGTGVYCCPQGCVGQACLPGQVCLPNPLSYCTLGDLIESIINLIFYVSLAIGPLMAIIGAFYLLTAGGDPARVNTGKNILLYTVIGLAVVFLSKAVVAVVRAAFSGA